MNSDETVLLIFPSYCTDIRRAKILPVVKRRFELRDISIRQITYEQSCIVVEGDNLVDAMSSISEIYGIDEVAIANMVSNQFQDIVNCIVRVGKQIVVPNCSFFIKILVGINAKVDFVSKDLQFVASGNLLTEAANDKHPLKIASEEKRADYQIKCYVGRNSSYVFIHSEIGLGGLPFNYQDRKVLSSIHNVVSAASCLTSLKCGLVPDICLLYHDDQELKENVKLLGHIANRTNLTRLNLKVGHINSVTRDRSGEEFLVNEALAITLLTLLPGRNIVLPLNVFIHPFSFIELTTQKMRQVNKVILTPLLFLTGELFDIIKTLGTGDRLTTIDKLNLNVTADRQQSRKCYDKVDKLSQSLLDNLKTISVKIGPNYIHDIIDAI
jgi:hypothetical protein